MTFQKPSNRQRPETRDQRRRDDEVAGCSRFINSLNEVESVGVGEAVIIKCNYCLQGVGVGRLCYTCKVPLHQFCCVAIFVNRG